MGPNAREGIYVDELRFHVACPRTPCVSVENCESAGPCTSSECINGLCVEEAIPGCCVGEADCNDFNPCTAVLCE